MAGGLVPYKRSTAGGKTWVAVIQIFMDTWTSRMMIYSAMGLVLSKHDGSYSMLTICRCQCVRKSTSFISHDNGHTGASDRIG